MFDGKRDRNLRWRSENSELDKPKDVMRTAIMRTILEVKALESDSASFGFSFGSSHKASTSAFGLFIPMSVFVLSTFFLLDVTWFQLVVFLFSLLALPGLGDVYPTLVSAP